MTRWLLWREPYTPATEAGDNIVFSGDSQTASDYWPPLFLAKLRGSPATANVAVGGKTILQLTADDATRVDPLFDADATTNVCICWAGTNDLSISAGDGLTAAGCYNRIAAYAVARKAAGFRVMVGTVLPRGNASDPTAYESERVALNTLLRADSSFADGLIDVALDARLGAPTANNNTTFFLDEGGAKVHITSGGGAPIFAAVAAREYLAMKRRLFE